MLFSLLLRRSYIVLLHAPIQNKIQETNNPSIKLNSLNHMRDYGICLIIHTIALMILLTVGIATGFLPLASIALVVLSAALIGYQSYWIVKINQKIEEIAQAQIQHIGREFIDMITQNSQLIDSFRRD